jgi:predicted MFS family arabinose efflux permease
MQRMIETPQQFKRDAYTWLAYGLLGYFAFFQISSGIVVPFLRSELGFSYTVGGLHVSALALGIIVYGLIGARLVLRFGRGRVLWLCSVGLNVGALVVVVGWHAALTVLGMFLVGLFGSAILVIVNASLADQHKHLKAYALTEANIAAAFTATTAPLLIGGMAALGLGWRVGLMLPLLVWLILILRVRPRVRVPDAVRPRKVNDIATTEQPLPRLYWVYLAALVFGVSAEWCVNAWSVVFLDDWVGLSSSAAATLYFVLLGAGAVARIGGSILTRRFPADYLLIVALILAGVGFTIFWLSPVLPLTLLGMVITGMGVANIYPMGLSATTNAAEAAIDLGSARISVGVGVAILVLPQALGALADVVGIFTAFGTTLIMLVLAIVVSVYAITQARLNAT